jgi:xylono-1,5-lactonase
MSYEAKLFIAAAHSLAESIHWQAERNRLLWVDLLEPALHIHDFATARTASHALKLSPPIGSFVLTDDSNAILLSHRQGLSVLHIDTLAMTPFCDPEKGRDAIIYNDMKVDRFGRLWVGTSHVREKEPRGALWCVSTDGVATLVEAGFPISNGPAFSPDGHTMYFNDSAGRQTLAYDLDPARPGAWNRRIFATYAEEEGLPDGIITDAEGCLWSAQWLGSRMIRLSPAGEKLAHVAVPVGNVTTMCFAGDNLDALYITTARDGLDAAALASHPQSGGIFTLGVPVKGLAEPRFPLGNSRAC